MDETSKKDLYDRLMALPGIRFFEPFYVAHKEVLLYLLFGGIAFVLNIALFALLNVAMQINELIANVFCWFACVLFQYITNRNRVFDCRKESFGEMMGQMISFLGGRLFTLAVEEAILAVFITWLGFNSMAVKLIAQVVVTVLNFIISKLIIFRK